MPDDLVSSPEWPADQRQEVRLRRWQYAILTVILCAPLLWAFGALRNTYPVAAWTVMTDSSTLERGRTYFVLRGETVSGQTFDIPAIHLTNAMYGRNWGMVAATAQNASFALTYPHPRNVQLLEAAGGLAYLPRGARFYDLLRAWAETYNARLPAASPHRLRAIWLDSYRWEGGSYASYDRFLETWRVEL